MRNSLRPAGTLGPVLAKALEVWPLETIEEALGVHAERVLPEAVRTKEVRARLPRYHVAMLEYIAHGSIRNGASLPVFDGSFPNDPTDD